MAVARSGAGFVACLLVVAGCRFGYDPIEAKASAQIAESDADIIATDGQGGNVIPADDAGSVLSDTSILDVLTQPDVTELPDVVSDGSAFDEASDAPPLSNVVVVDLSDPTSMVRNGAARIDGTSLNLVTGEYFQAGSAYLPTPYAIGPTTTFSIAFSFRLYGVDGVGGADGFTLVWQNAAPTALGGAGSSLGYANAVAPSVAVEFDTYKTAGNDQNDNHVAVDTGGNEQVALAAAWTLPFDLNDGAPHNAWVDYDGATKTVTVYLSDAATKPAVPLLVGTADLATLVGSSGYLGFTGGCGLLRNVEAITAMSVSYKY
jgi:hypothetical protein